MRHVGLDRRKTDMEKLTRRKSFTAGELKKSNIGV